ncbi:MAG: hypothetical protein H6Q25_720 [Bacteroidetes bacterium]|nr:hypothetical protein [Bacteroidota bacterium]
MSLNFFKKYNEEVANIEYSKEHMEYVPDNVIDTQILIEKLEQIAKVGYPSYKLDISDHKICICPPRFNILTIIGILIYLYFVLVSIFASNHNYIAYIIVISVTIFILLLIRLRNYNNDFEIDLYKKKIKIKNNNIVGKIVLPEVELYFDEFSDFSYKRIMAKDFPFFRIYIHYGNSKKSFIQLSGILYSQLNILIFIDCLSRIIKNDR